ncbi:MAG: 1,4-dihydroxy-2-naphthoate octaprenyltransferase [Simkaniaceae bacterium]|nr:1,4-dihydroxy-2-naphthoate octaprenyltransferase [Simkaniaceae bacterium]
MRYFVEASRPKTLIASIAPVLIGVLHARSPRVDSYLLFCTLLATLSLQIGTNFANDYLDGRRGGDTSLRKGPRRLTSAGFISECAMKRATAITFALVILFALPLIAAGGKPIAGLVLLSVLLGYLYSGGPYPLSHSGIADLFVFFFFGPVASATTAYLQTGRVSMSVAVAGCAPGLLSVALLTANNLRDVAEDTKQNKRTFPVRFGTRAGAFEYAFCLVVASLLPAVLSICTGRHPLSAITIVMLPFAKPLIRSAFISQERDALFPRTGKWMVCHTLLFLIGSSCS